MRAGSQVGGRRPHPGREERFFDSCAHTPILNCSPVVSDAGFALHNQSQASIHGDDVLFRRLIVRDSTHHSARHQHSTKAGHIAQYHLVGYESRVGLRVLEESREFSQPGGVRIADGNNVQMIRAQSDHIEAISGVMLKLGSRSEVRASRNRDALCFPIVKVNCATG